MTEPTAVVRGKTLPGWALRLALAIVVVALTVLAMVTAPELGLGSALGPVLVLVALVAVAAPAGTAPLLLIGGVVALRAVGPGALFDWTLAVEVPLVVAVHQLAALTAAIPWRSVSRVAALRPTALRGAMVALPTMIVVIVLALLT